jgi:histidine triad (HIT) family protein
MENCIFCKIINKKAPAKIVFENDDILALVPKGEISKGHTLVIPKKHFENIFDIDKNILEKLIAVSKDLSETLTKENNATGINLLHASGKDAQQSVFHFHFHIVPRYENDGLDLWLREKL